MFIYIIRCQGETLYTGITTDITRRLRQHAGLIAGGAKYTKSHKILSLEALWSTPNDTDARKLECALKKLTKNQKLDLISSPCKLTSKYCTGLGEADFMCEDPSLYSVEDLISKHTKKSV
ncbi:MAG: GIY-YIG nuclease family protein [Oscillospiraceae bacterium]|nr:GIY-YIG nuclease family protein [Oscillospiraceae bacterium]